MDVAHLWRRLLVGDQAVTRGIIARHRGAVWLFIVLVALFLTQPADYPYRHSQGSERPPAVRVSTADSAR